MTETIGHAKIVGTDISGKRTKNQYRRNASCCVQATTEEVNEASAEGRKKTPGDATKEVRRQYTTQTSWRTFNGLWCFEMCKVIGGFCLISFLDFYFLFYVCECFSWFYACAPCVSGTCGGQKNVLSFLELELQTVVSYYEGAENWTSVPCKSNRWSYEPCLSPVSSGGFWVEKILTWSTGSHCMLC